MLFGFKMIKNKKAQIVLPAILLIPTILLVIYLLFETTKLSREKIRHQFALDTASFVELTSTSNYLNGVAYINGSFPFRVFSENFEPDKPKFGRKGDDDNKELTLYDLFYMGGAFPAMEEYNSEPKDTDTEWELDYYDGDMGRDNPRADWNKAGAPTIDDEVFYPIMSKALAEKYGIGWNQDAIRIYMMVYVILGDTYEGQKAAYLKMTKSGEFFRKGYYLNAHDCKLSECGRQGAALFKDYVAKTDPVYIQKIEFYYVNPEDSTDMTNVLTFDLIKDELINGKLLFQYAYVDKGYTNSLRKLYKGIGITQPFKAPDNYFKVNLNKYHPRNHVRVALQCTKEDNNCVWPNPTPKYQVRIFP